MIDTEQLIKDGLSRAKWQAQLERMTEARKYLDYYNYRQNERSQYVAQYSYMQKRIAERFPATQQEMFPYISTYPITEQIIKDISLLFNKPPEITINPDQKLDPASKLVLLFKDELIDKPMLYPTLLTTNRLTNLLGKVGVMPRWYKAGNELEYVIITPDKCIVLQDPDSPTHVTAVLYQEDSLVDTAQATKKVDDWIMVTDKEISKVKLDKSTGNPQFISSEPNQYGMIPIAWFQNDLPIEGFWIDKGNPIVEANEIYNINKTQEKLAITYQMYSTLVLKNMPIDKLVDWGVRAIVHIDSSNNPELDADAKYITPDPKLRECSDIMEGEINSIAGYAGLSEEAYRKKTNSFTSGYHLKLSKQDVINNNEQEIPFYTAGIKKLLDIAVAVYNKHGKGNLKAVKTYSIDYAPVKFEVNPIEQRQVWAMDKMYGIMSPIDMIRELNPDLSQEEAEKRYEEVQKALKQFGNKMIEDMENNLDNEDDNE